MKYGGYLGTNMEHTLNWKELQRLTPTVKFGGGWIVKSCTKQKIPRRKTHLLIVELEDSFNTVEPITARIWKVPSTVSTIQSDCLLVISPERACIKEFNSLFQIHVNYQHIQIVQPHHIRSYHRRVTINIIFPLKYFDLQFSHSIYTEFTQFNPKKEKQIT